MNTHKALTIHFKPNSHHETPSAAKPSNSDTPTEPNPAMENSKPPFPNDEDLTILTLAKTHPLEQVTYYMLEIHRERHMLELEAGITGGAQHFPLNITEEMVEAYVKENEKSNLLKDLMERNKLFFEKVGYEIVRQCKSGQHHDIVDA
ncbi:MAG: hypothetical protein Q9218_002551, partial [Villophora microphyllina]